MVLKFVLNIVGGWAGHQTRAYVDAAVKNLGWNRIVSYMLGILFGYPMVETMAMEVIDQAIPELIPFKGRIKLMLRLAYFLAFFPMGMGTILGFMIDQALGTDGE